MIAGVVRVRIPHEMAHRQYMSNSLITISRKSSKMGQPSSTTSVPFSFFVIRHFDDEENYPMSLKKFAVCFLALCLSASPTFASNDAKEEERVKDALLPAICGRVCPQESQCQENCMVAKIHKDLGFAVSVGKIEAFLADWEREVGGVELPAVAAPRGFRVAIIGAGPSGLTCAGDLRRFGH